MALFPNNQENNQKVRKNLKAHGYSEGVIDEVIDTISAVDRTKENLGVSNIHQSAQDKIQFIEHMYDQEIKVFYTYLKHLNQSQFTLNKSILAKYKSNICKYLYILASENNIDPHAENFIKNSFGTIKRTDKVLSVMDRVEANKLGNRKDILIGRDRTLNNPGHGMARDKRKEQSTAAFLQEQVGNETSHNAPVIVKVIDGGLELTDEMKARFESAGTHKQGTSFTSPIGSAQIATTWHQDTSKQ